MDHTSIFNMYVREYSKRQRMKKLGYHASYDSACSLETSIFEMIDQTFDKIREAERKSKNGKK